MKIGFFTEAYLPLGFGVETSIETFRKNLEKLGHEVYIFAPFYPDYKDTNPRVFRFRSLKIIKKPEMRFAFPFLPVNSIKKIINLKLDIVHCHTPFSLGLFGRYVSAAQKIPTLYTHHTQYPDYAKIYLKETVVFPYLAKVWSVWFSNSTDGVIAPSSKIRKILRDWGVTKPISVLATGINAEVFKKSPASRQILRKRLKIPQKAKVLLFVGRIGQEKNIGFLLKAFKEVLKKSALPVFLLMVGDGPDLERFSRLAEKLKVHQSVKFLGQIPYSKIPVYYQTADLFVFPSLSETQGIVILEAIASGLPVVALYDEAFSEMVISGKNGFLIKQLSIKNFAEKVLEVLGNSSLAKKFSKTSCEIAKNFSEEKQTKKLLAIYKNYI